MATGQDLPRHPAADEDPDRLIVAAGEAEKPRRAKRVASLDIFRGLTVAVLPLELLPAS